jgi:hypothetical protein
MAGGGKTNAMASWIWKNWRCRLAKIAAMLRSGSVRSSQGVMMIKTVAMLEALVPSISE